MKIFCIGLHKTGTVSLEAALQKLGFRTRHGWVKHSDMIKKAIHDGKKPLEYLNMDIGFNDPGADYAYLDLYAVRDHFVWMDKHYPGSKFILTVREENQWVESVKRQIKKRPDSPFFHQYYFQNELQWRNFKRMHENTVMEYFIHRPNDMLIINIPQGDGFAKLCDFLNMDMSGLPNEFPHKNKSPKS